jgi:hypothetical protein
MATTLKTALNRLIPQKRGKGRLPAADNRDPIPASKSRGKRSVGGGSGGGITPPLNEQSGVKGFHPLGSLVSSDGFFVLTRQHIASTEFLDGDGNSIPVNYVDE